MQQEKIGTTGDLRLGGLIQSPDAVSPRELWKALDLDERAAAIRKAMADGIGSVDSWVFDAVARHRGFRPKSVRQWSKEKLAEAAAGLIPPRVDVQRALLVAFHLSERRQMLEAYLDGLGVRHEGGVLPDDVGGEIDVTPSGAKSAVEGLLERFPAREVVIYLHVMRAQSPELLPGLEEWLPHFFEDEAPTPSHPDHEPLPADHDERGVSPDDTDQFTTLDRLLVRAIVDSAQGVEGSLEADEVVDVVEELIELNSARHRSFFELGFADVLLGRDPRRDLPARNASRAAWYWSGYVNGLAREGRNKDIVETFDCEPDVVRLGVSGRGPSSTALPLVFRALCDAGRHGEAASFLSVTALEEHPQMAVLVHEEGRQLLWDDRAPEARTFMDLLGRFVSRSRESDSEIPEWFELEVRRRQAHCFRQLGELLKAREILEELLEREADPEIQSMVHADLGLVAGGFRSLATVRLPDEEDTVGEVRDTLEKGKAHFQEGASINARFQAHGRFCLGVLAMTNGDWQTARQNLELALSGFEAQPKRYQAGGLLARTRLYLGVALALELDNIRVERASELLEDAVGDGEHVPRYLVARVLEALHISSPQCAHDVAERLLDSDPELLDLMVATDIFREALGLQQTLQERADDPDRSLEARARDYRRLLPELLARGDIAGAAGVLDALEEIAHKGVGVDALIDLLEQAENYDPAWEPRDALWARVRFLKMEGRYDDVAQALSKEFYSALHGDWHEGREDAGQIVELLASIGRTQEQLSRFRSALDDTAVDDEPAEAGSEDHTEVRVLFVGGDERQREAAEAVAEELRDEDPKLTVRFVHPGWSGNWGGTLERVLGMLDTYDAVVLMRFVRTEFGRRLRAELDIPWVPCTAAGKTRMKRSILRAAAWGRDHRTAPE
ncbi:MAG: hypothetical protein WD942_00980 [Dehalococcoidia bacterium]